MAISVNIDGVTREVSKPSVCIGGVWRDVTSVKNNIDGVWRECFSTNVYTINMYRYGELWKTVTVLEGESVTLDECDTFYDDDTFYGWSKGAGSIVISYTSGSIITPTTDLNLYAVFSYIGESTNTVSLSSRVTSSAQTNTIMQTYTIERSGEVTLTLKYGYASWSSSGGNGGADDATWNSTTSTSKPYYTYNGKVQTSTEFTAEKDKQLYVYLPSGTYQNNYNGTTGSGSETYYTCNITLPIYKTSYRVASHG